MRKASSRPKTMPLVSDSQLLALAPRLANAGGGLPLANVKCLNAVPACIYFLVIAKLVASIYKSS